jgi:glycosyltransferase involved in cell wall biosynthesis
LKILHLSPSFYPATFYGGPIRSGLALCTELVKLGCDIRVLTTNSNGPRVVGAPSGEEASINGVRVVYCQRMFRPDIAPSLLLRLPHYIRWADVVHITGVFNYTTLPGLAGAALWKKPVVWTPRGALMDYGLQRRRHLKRAWLWASGALCPRRTALHVTSEEEREQAAAALPGIPASIIANGVDIPEQVIRPRQGETLRLLYIGRLHSKKALENLLSALKMVPDAILTIGGEGEREYTAHLHRLTSELGLQDRVTFTGEVLGSAKRQLFDISDAFVMPSHSENFGISIAESLAHGVPVIASHGTPWSRIEEIGCGLWTGNSPESLAAAIRQVREMPLFEMGARGRIWIQSEYTWQPRAHEMIALYQELLRTPLEAGAAQSSPA